MNAAKATADLLRSLQSATSLKRCGDGSYALVGARGPRRRFVPALVEPLITRGLLRRESNCVVITSEGEAWLADGAEFVEQHQLLTTEKIKDERGRETFVVVNNAESALLLLFRRGLLEPQEVEAGEKLRRDYTIGQLTPRMSVDYAAVLHTRSHRPDMAETALAARQRFNAAMKSLGPSLGDVVFDICCYLKGLEESEKARSWPRGSAKVVLRLALQRLAAFYGFGAPKHARTRHWRSDENTNGD